MLLFTPAPLVNSPRRDWGLEDLAFLVLFVLDDSLLGLINVKRGIVLLQERLLSRCPELKSMHQWLRRSL